MYPYHYEKQSKGQKILSRVPHLCALPSSHMAAFTPAVVRIYSGHREGAGEVRARALSSHTYILEAVLLMIVLYKLLEGFLTVG